MPLLMFDEPWAWWRAGLTTWRSISSSAHLAVIPCLVLTNMLGPTGFLAYLILRAVMRRTFTLQEIPSPTGR